MIQPSFSNFASERLVVKRETWLDEKSNQVGTWEGCSGIQAKQSSSHMDLSQFEDKAVSLTEEMHRQG